MKRVGVKAVVAITCALLGVAAPATADTVEVLATGILTFDGSNSMSSSTFIGSVTMTARAVKTSSSSDVTCTRAPFCSMRYIGVDNNTSGLPSSTIASINALVPPSNV